jgi:hypothetical protein
MTTGLHAFTPYLPEGAVEGVSGFREKPEKDGPVQETKKEGLKKLQRNFDKNRKRDVFREE